MTEPLVRIRSLRVQFPLGGGLFRRPSAFFNAVNDVSLEIPRGATVALVGESGCGKTTAGRALLRISDEGAIESGSIWFDGVDLRTLSASNLRPYRRRMQGVFQDPKASLNPRMTIFDIIAEPLRVHRMYRTHRELEHRIGELMEQVGLDASLRTNYPHEFSGGMQQRIGIARAIALDPDFIVCDEPTSALDVSIQEQVIQLLARLQRERMLTYLFISHNLAVVERIANIVAVMYFGEIVEIGPTAQVIGKPKHPYTQALLSAVPIPDPEKQRKRKRVVLTGDVPDPKNPPPGCSFHPRCPLSDVVRNTDGAIESGRCATPQTLTTHDGREIACWCVTSQAPS